MALMALGMDRPGSMRTPAADPRSEMRAIRCAVNLELWARAPRDTHRRNRSGSRTFKEELSHVRQRDGQDLLPDVCAPMRLLVDRAQHAQARIHAGAVPGGTG